MLAHPQKLPTNAKSASTKSRFVGRNFILRSGMSRADFVTFHRLAQFPAGDHIGNATILLHAANYDFGHQFAIAAHQQFAVLQHALIFADVKHHEIPFGIHHNNLAAQISAQNDETVGAGPRRLLHPDLHRDDFAIYENGVRQHDATVEIEHVPITGSIPTMFTKGVISRPLTTTSTGSL